jgi:hypothetical protein
MARTMRIAGIAGIVVGWGLTLIGIAGVPEDVKTWQGWLKPLAQILDQNIARWLLVLAGVTLALTAQFGSRVRTWWRSRRAREALRVVIERAEWTNFRHLALILEMRVSVTNRTDTRKQLAAMQLQIHSGGQVAKGSEHVEVLREVEHRKQRRNTLDRISVLEPRETVTGWMVFAFPWKTTPGEPEYTFSVIDELKNEYQARMSRRNKISRAPRQIDRLASIRG